MCGVAYSLSLLLAAEKILPHLCDSLFVEAVEWLIKYQNLRILHSRLSKPEALSHTEGILADVPSEVRVNSHLKKIDLLSRFWQYALLPHKPHRDHHSRQQFYHHRCTDCKGYADTSRKLRALPCCKLL